MRQLIHICVWLSIHFACNAALSSPTMSPLTARELSDKIKKAGASATVVNLWATWCGPCKKEMPELIELRKKWVKQGVQLILISGDAEDDMKSASEFLGKLGVTFAAYRLGEAPDQFMKEFIANWPAVLPTTLLFDRNGRKTAGWTGQITLKDLERKLTEALKTAPLQQK